MSEFIIGIDEVGTGSFAGPLVVGGVLAPKDWYLEGLNDSKKLTPKRRASMYDKIVDSKPFIQYVLEWRWPEYIDKVGVGRAHRDAIETAALTLLERCPDAEVIIDGSLRYEGFEYRSIPKADGLYPGVMAASILAKVERDRWMQTEADSLYPQYDFGSHVGYGTPAHIKALDEHGPCKIHRYSYEPVARRVISAKTLTNSFRL